MMSNVKLQISLIINVNCRANCINIFVYLYLFIFAFYKSVKGKPVGYRTSHKCLLWNESIKY